MASTYVLRPRLWNGVLISELADTSEETTEEAEMTELTGRDNRDEVKIEDERKRS